MMARTAVTLTAGRTAVSLTAWTDASPGDVHARCFAAASLGRALLSSADRSTTNKSLSQYQLRSIIHRTHQALPQNQTRSQAVARIANRTASQQTR